MVEPAELDIINLLLLLALAWIFGNAAERVGYPAMIGEIGAGIVFGPPLLGVLQSTESLAMLAELGIFLLMVHVGMEVNPHELFELGPQSTMVAFGGFLFPFGLGYLVGDLIGTTIEQSLFIGIAMAATSLATKSRILVDLELLDTRIAGVLLGGALLSDIGILVAFAGITGFIETGAITVLGVATVLLRVVVFFAFALAIGEYLLPPVWARLELVMKRLGFMDKTSAFTVALIVALLFAFLASIVELHIIIGGFIAGMLLRQAQPDPDVFGHMQTVIYDLAMGFFAPIFFVLVGFELTLDVFTQDLRLLVLIVTVAFVGKIVGSWVFTLPTELTTKEGVVIGFGMNGRGTVEIIIVSIGLTMGIVTQQLFSILVFMAIFTTALVPVTMKLGVDWLERSEELVYLDEDHVDEPETTE